MDYQPPYHLTEKMVGLCTEIAGQVRELSLRSGASSHPSLHRAERIRSVHSSLAIEHNSLSLDQVSAVLDGKYVLAPQQEVLEVQNAFRAYDRLPELDPNNMDDLLRAHRCMMENLVSGAGMLRSEGVGVYRGTKLLHAGTPAQYVPEVMAQLFGWLKESNVHPLIKSCVFHYEFEFIHPFMDGNGHTGRLWQTLILMKWEPIFAFLPIESMILAHQQGYYDALNVANNQGESTVFIEFMLEMILEALAEVYVSQQESPDTTTPETRLMLLLSTDSRLTIPQMAERLAVSQRTISRLLKQLQEQGKLRREGSPKNGRWIIIH